MKKIKLYKKNILVFGFAIKYYKIKSNIIKIRQIKIINLNEPLIQK